MTMKFAGLCVAVAASLLAAQSASAQTGLASPESVGMSSQKLALIHDALKVNIDSGQIPGGVVLVARNGKVVYMEAQGFGDASGKTALRTDTIFALASLSKPMTAVAILMLVEEGKIGLEDPISKYVPELGANRQVRVLKPGSPPYPYSAMPGVIPEQSEYGPAAWDLVPAKREMTVRDLLTHTSGIQIFGVGNNFPTAARGETLAQFIPRLAQAPLEYQPGAQWAYSNGIGFDVLGRVVEVASGMSFKAFLHQRLIDPLGMKDTDFGVHPDAVSRALALGPRVQTSDQVVYFSGAAGLSSTVPDYAKFVQMLLDGGEAGGRRYLKPETVKAMASNQIGWLQMDGYPPMAMPHEGLRFGYGVLTVSKPLAAGTTVPAGSFGWDGVGTRRWWAIPDEHIEIVTMVNLIGPAAAPFQRVVEAAVMSSLIQRNSTAQATSSQMVPGNRP